MRCYASILLVVTNLFWVEPLLAKNLALIIGNSQYQDKPLNNPGNDADDMGTLMQSLEFDLYGGQVYKDLTAEEMDELLIGFYEAIESGATNLFYFAGHGASDDANNNYLIPLDARIKRQSQIKRRAINLSEILESMRVENQGGTNLVFVDACRDQPFGRSYRSGKTRTLVRTVVPAGTFVGLAAGEGQAAEDGKDRNGLFTGHLLNELEAGKGQLIEQVYKQVVRKVAEASENKQRPISMVDLDGDFCFGGCEAQPTAVQIQMNSPPTPEETSPAPNHSASSEPTATATPVPPGAPYEPEMMALSGGCFQMGSPLSEDERSAAEIQHKVCVEPILASKFEVTKAQFETFITETRYKTDAERNITEQGCGIKEGSFWHWQANLNWRNPGFTQNPEEPVVCISWNDAQAYIDWLNNKTGKHYRLPTEAEWEFAARSNSQAARYWGQNSADACDYANVADSSAQSKYSDWEVHDCNDQTVHTQATGSYRANGFDLYDTLGNVWEWTCSEFDGRYKGGEKNCQESFDEVVAARGGSWTDKPKWVRSANRRDFYPSDRTNFLGFRLFQEQH